MVKKAFEHLRPGGWVEYQVCVIPGQRHLDRGNLAPSPAHYSMELIGSQSSRNSHWRFWAWTSIRKPHFETTQRHTRDG